MMIQKNKQKIYGTILHAGWLVSLILVSLVLITKSEPGSFQYWARVGVVSIAWCVYFLCFTSLRAFANIKVITERVDNFILLLILFAFLLLIVSIFINLLASGGYGVAVPVGLVCLGLFNVIRDLIHKMVQRPGSDGKHKKKGSMTSE